MKPEIQETSFLDEAVRAARLRQPKITVNVSQFQTLFCPNQVCIARSMPQGLNIPHLKVLAPSPELLRQWCDSDKSKKSWVCYTRQYWDEISTRWSRNSRTYHGATNGYRSDGRSVFSRSIYLAFVLRAAARTMEVNELTLCCYEKEMDEHCHRKLVFDALPEEMKGGRG